MYIFQVTVPFLISVPVRISHYSEFSVEIIFRLDNYALCVPRAVPKQS